MPSERVRKLIEDLHEIHSVERRWEIVEAAFAEEFKDLTEQLVDVHAKLEYIAACMETEDGIFSFPDGDSVPTKKLHRP